MTGAKHGQSLKIACIKSAIHCWFRTATVHGSTSQFDRRALSSLLPIGKARKWVGQAKALDR